MALKWKSYQQINQRRNVLKITNKKAEQIFKEQYYDIEIKTKFQKQKLILENKSTDHNWS